MNKTTAKETDLLLALRASPKNRARTSFMIDVDEYKKFKQFCLERTITPSDLLDALIKDFNSEIRTPDE